MLISIRDCIQETRTTLPSVATPTMVFVKTQQITYQTMKTDKKYEILDVLFIILNCVPTILSSCHILFLYLYIIARINCREEQVRALTTLLQAKTLNMKDKGMKFKKGRNNNAT